MMRRSLYDGPATPDFDYAHVYDRINAIPGSSLVHRSLVLDQHVRQGDIWCVWNIGGVTVVYTQHNEFIWQGRVMAELVISGSDRAVGGIERKLDEALGIPRNI